MLPGPAPTMPIPRSASRFSHLSARLSSLSLRSGSSFSRHRWLWSCVMQGCSAHPTKLQNKKKADLDPLLLFLREHILLHHLCMYRHARQTLEAEPDVAVEFAFGLLDYQKKNTQSSISRPRTQTHPNTRDSQRRLDAHPPHVGVI